MKNILFVFALVLSLSALADSSTMKLVLDQPEVEKLEQDLATKGFSLFQVTDLYAKQGMVPRCPCENLEVKFAKVNGDNSVIKTFSVTTNGFGTSLKVKIEEVK